MTRSVQRDRRLSRGAAGVASRVLDHGDPRALVMANSRAKVRLATGAPQAAFLVSLNNLGFATEIGQEPESYRIIISDSFLNLTASAKKRDRFPGLIQRVLGPQCEMLLPGLPETTDHLIKSTWR
jgi:hypothetical protein